MKKILTLCFALSLLFSYSSVQAQIADGSTAPDFTATDIDGVEWNLYDILEDGKSVILDVSATWCGPCWSYHTSGTLETLYEDYGPNGTDELRIFMIEGDPATNVDCLYGPSGCNNTTLGDWTAGTEYPIIDDASIADAYQITYYPTMFTICPDKIVVESGQISVAAHYALISDCPVQVGVNNAMVTNLETPTIICDGELAFAPELDITNVGSIEMSSVMLQLYFDGSEMGDPYEWTGSLSTWGADHIVMDEITIPGSGQVSVEVLSVNGQTDEDPSNNEVVSDVSSIDVQMPADSVTVSIMTDNYGEETYWEILVFAGNVIAWGGNELACAGCGQYPNLSGGYASNTQYDEVVYIPANGCYNFNIIDDYGDGLLSGFYKLIDAEGTTVFEGTGAFTEVDNPFRAELTPVSNNEITGLSALTLFPSPVSNDLTIRFNLNETTELGVAVYNALGQQVNSLGYTTYGTGNNDISLNASAMANGVYFVTIQSDTQSVTKKFTVSK